MATNEELAKERKYKCIATHLDLLAPPQVNRKKETGSYKLVQ